jgi:O-antigen/teichoic acid export membrane protein
VGLNAVLSVLLIVFVSVHDYGIYSYAVALSAIGSSVMTAGLNGISVKELVNHREKNAAIVSGLLVVRELFAVFGFVIIGIVSFTSGDNVLVLAALLSTMALFARAFDAPEAWFLSNLRSAKPALVRIVVALALFGLRLAILFFYPNIWLLLGMATIEALAVSSGILWQYLRAADSPGLKRPAVSEVFGLVRHSWPLLLSGLANQVNLKGSILVIQTMLGTPAVAVYSAAARLSEITFFLPVVFMNSTLPVLLEVRKSDGPDSRRYHRMLQRSYDQAFWAGVGVAVGVGIVGSIVIRLAFGEAYEESVSLLVIQLAACPFVFMAAVYSKWIIAEGYYWSSLVRHSMGAVANIGLNIMLIPEFGLIGSAMATVSSYVVASYLAAFLGKRSAVAGRQMTLAIIAPVRGIAWLLSRRNGRPRS